MEQAIALDGVDISALHFLRRFRRSL